VNLLDLLLIVIVGYSVIAGFAAGFARVGVGFAATILGILCGFWMYRIPGSWLQDYLRSATAANLLGFFIVFSAVVLAGGVVGKILSTAFKWVGLSWLDRILGAGFGFVRGAVLAVAIVTVITAFAPHPPPRFIVDSKVMPYAATAGSAFAALAPRELRDAYHDSVARLRRLWDQLPAPGKPEKMKGEQL
jgi:membrane protein required for colicin V production